MADEPRAAEAPRPASELRGIVDNATEDRVFGWAWDASYPSHRVPLELRLAGEVVATATADYPRPDLADNGVGDGCHAFEFAVLTEWLDRVAELTVTAWGGDGQPYPIPVRLFRPEDVPVGTRLQRAVEVVAAEHQVIRAEHAELRALAQKLPQAEEVAAVSRENAALHRRLDELELWIARLDGRLAASAAPPAGTSGSRLDTWQVVLIAVLVAAASASIAVAVTAFGS